MERTCTLWLKLFRRLCCDTKQRAIVFGAQKSLAKSEGAKKSGAEKATTLLNDYFRLVALCLGAILHARRSWARAQEPRARLWAGRSELIEFARAPHKSGLGQSSREQKESDWTGLD